MKNILLFTFFFFYFQNCFGQELRVLSGKVLDEYLDEMPLVDIMINDSTKIATTDLKGNFKIQVNSNTEKLIFECIGCEATKVILKPDCNNLEVIILLSGGDCFAKPKKIERDRKKRFKTLPSLYKSAYEKGLFKSINPCGHIEFISGLSDDKKPSP